MIYACLVLPNCKHCLFCDFNVSFFLHFSHCLVAVFDKIL